MENPHSSRVWLASSWLMVVMAVIAGGATFDPQIADPFVDDDTSVHEADIEAIAAAGITEGCNPPDNDHYCPDDPMTRGQMAAFLRRAFELSAVSDDHFLDDEGSIFEEDIDAIAAAGFTLGCNPPEGDHYCPDEPVSRGQMATFLARALQLRSAANDYFLDDDESVYASDINAIAAAGITIGCNPPDNDQYCPDEPVSRGQMASLLARAFGWSPPVTPGTTSTTSTTLPATEHGLNVSYSEDRADPWALEGSGVAGDVFVFAVTDLGSVEQVVFSLDGDEVRTEKNAPYDLAGGSAESANPFDTTELSDGTHTVSAVFHYSDESSASVSASFTVNNNDEGGDDEGDDDEGDDDEGSTTTTTTVIDIEDGIPIAPGESIQAKVDDHADGTVFVILAGTHYGQSVEPKEGNVFVGEPGAVLDGEDSEEYAFEGGSANVVIVGLEIRNYDSPAKDGAVAWGPGATDWVVEGNEIHNNTSSGVRFGPGWQVIGNNIHHNGQYGVNGSGEDVLIEDNEIAYNNTCDCNPGAQGGTKFNNTEDLVVRGNYAHDNTGPGLWTDINNTGTLYEDNVVTGNTSAGIKVEISYDTIIRDNVVEANGFGDDRWVSGAGILVNTSPNVEVYGNVVSYNADGIAGIEQDRSDTPAEPAYGEWALEDLWVHDNTIVMDTGYTGVVTDTDSDSVFSDSWNNRFDYNDYTLEGSGDFYRWDDQFMTAAEWQDAGQDANSTWD